LSARPSPGDLVAPPSTVIEVRVAELRQLFNAIDPSPFRERDLDPRAEAFMVEWARDVPRDAPLALRVHLERACGRADEATRLGDAIHQFFSQRALASRRELRELLRRGRISLVIAIAFLSAAMVGSDLIGSVAQSHFVQVFREGLLIGGWVAMWRPLEVFLYDWWPVLAEARLSERLSMMPVSIQYAETAGRDAWRSDWPAVAAPHRSGAGARGESAPETPGRPASDV
jgi:hypothetical protein